MGFDVLVVMDFVFFFRLQSYKLSPLRQNYHPTILRQFSAWGDFGYALFDQLD